ECQRVRYRLARPLQRQSRLISKALADDRRLVRDYPAPYYVQRHVAQRVDYSRSRRRYLLTLCVRRRCRRCSYSRLPRRHRYRSKRRYDYAQRVRRQIARRAKEAHHSTVLVLLPRRQCRRDPRIITLESKVECRCRQRYLAAGPDTPDLTGVEEFEDLRLRPFSYQARPERICIRRFRRASKVD